MTLWVGSITTASFEDTVVFTGPEASVITSLNFALDGSVSGPEGSTRTVGPLLYLDTFTLASGGPAFDLPAGFTANAPDLGIIDNVHHVPEPAVAWLLASASGVLGYDRRRRE